MKERLTFGTFLIYVFFVGVLVIMIYPFWHALMASFMTSKEYYTRTILWIVTDPTLDNYREVFKDGVIWRPFLNTFLITLVGASASLFFTAWLAFGLSKKFKGSSFIMHAIVLTMIIKPGIIPEYLLYKRLGIINTYLVFLLPALTYPFFLIIMRTNFKSIPRDLEEASIIDGCDDFGYFFKIALPLSKAMLATVGLFVAVNFWNTLFPSLFFITKEDLRTLQDYLYRIITDEGSFGFSSSNVMFSETIKMANVIITVLPILFVYPFAQRFFVSGMMIGAIKE